MGEITRQSGNGLKNLGVLFSNFLQGQNQVSYFICDLLSQPLLTSVSPALTCTDRQTLQVTGKEVVSPAQPNSPVDWLSAAFKKLTINVILPGHVYEIISAITIDDLTVELTKASQDFNVPSSTNRTDATYK